MGKLVAVIYFLAGASVFASTNGYDLKMELSINDKHISSPRIIAKEGETALVTQDSNGEKIFVEVIATEKPTDNKKSILMRFVIGTISSTGEKKILSTPQMIALENERAEISVGNQAKKVDLDLSIIATRKVL